MATIATVIVFARRVEGIAHQRAAAQDSRSGALLRENDVERIADGYERAQLDFVAGLVLVSSLLDRQGRRKLSGGKRAQYALRTGTATSISESS
jgi:hypothetical protein